MCSDFECPADFIFSSARIKEKEDKNETQEAPVPPASLEDYLRTVSK